MPKILENPEEKILTEAKKMLIENGYKSFSMRELSKRASIALGTIYNYYENKDSLINSIFSTEWESIIYSAKKISISREDTKIKLNNIFILVKSFLDNNIDLFLEISSFRKSSHSNQKDKVISPLAVIVEDILINSNYKLRAECSPLALLIVNNIVVLTKDPFISFEEFLDIVL